MAALAVKCALSKPFIHKGWNCRRGSASPSRTDECVRRYTGLAGFRLEAFTTKDGIVDGLGFAIADGPFGYAQGKLRSSLHGPCWLTTQFTTKDTKVRYGKPYPASSSLH